MNAEKKPTRFAECARCEHTPDDYNCIHCIDLSGFVCENDGNEENDGTSGQDRKSYTDTQDRKTYAEE